MTTAATLSAEGWVLIITAVSTMIVLPIIKMIVDSRREAKAQADRTELAKVVQSTHTFVNSAMGAVLRTLAVTLRRLAVETRKPEDAKAAAEAEERLAEHEAAQKLVDQRAAA